MAVSQGSDKADHHARMHAAFRWSVPADYVPPMSNVSLPYPKDGLPVDLQSLPAVTRKISR